MTTPRIAFHKMKLQAPECTIYLALGNHQLAALSKRLNLPEDYLADFEDGYVDGMFGTDPEGMHLFIALSEEYNPITTAHECIHAAGRLWAGVGANLHVQNDEVITYTHDAIHKMIKDIYDAY